MTRRPVLVAAMVYLALGLAWLASNDWDPASFAWFDREGHPVTAEAEQLLDRDVAKATRFGHDGRWFWALAHDPLLLDPDDTAELLDRPGYRSRRVLLPLAAAPALALGEEALLWWFPVFNLLVVLAGTAAAARLARAVGAPVDGALAYTLNPAVLFAFLINSADALAVALAVTGLWAWLTGRRTAAVVGFAAAGLARELFLALPAVLGVITAMRCRIRTAAVLVVGSAAPVVAWTIYTRVRLGAGSQVDEIVVPFAGFVRAWRETWSPLGYWQHFAVAIAAVLFALWVVIRWARRRHSVLLTAALPFALLYPFLAGEVVHLAHNSTRALGPAVTFAVLSVLAERQVRAVENEAEPGHDAAGMSGPGSDVGGSSKR